ncbi:MAG: VWA domain-containing protein [Proteobacteria bacterium]|nr:VWA domain-containing protein [Pseudomonadota bacterium]
MPVDLIGVLALISACQAGVGDPAPAPPPPDALGRAGSGPSGPGKPVPGAACVGQTQRARAVQLDMYIMLDRSGSMMGWLDAASNTQSKWRAVASALEEFLRDPRSKGLGVGLQYFPLPRGGVPDACEQDTECAGNGPCLNGVCSDRSTLKVRFCASDQHCTGASNLCEPFGQCSLDLSVPCTTLGAGGCDRLGDCLAPRARCAKYASCHPADYAEPAVAIDSLPENAAKLEESLRAQAPVPGGLTPTAPALKGALQRAQLRVRSHPEHTVVAVLATDGQPTSVSDAPASSICYQIQPHEIGAIARAGRRAGVRTYAIGVLSGSQADALESLKALASDGGTGEPLLVDPGSDLTGQFLSALDTIRRTTLDCEFKLPVPHPATRLELDKVNVRFTDAAGVEEKLIHVGAKTNCEANPRGWYYDHDPATGGKPSKIQVCDDVCETFKNTKSGRVDIELGCKTLVLL